MGREVFFSYAWGGESENIVNEIDKIFQQKGINIIRDKRDLGFKGMITDFMNQIGKGKAVIVVISDKYLKSPYCMYELLEIYKNLQFQERIFPIVLDDAKIFDPLPRLQYLKHWQDKKKELDEAIKEFGTDAITVIGDDYKTYKKIFDNFGEVINILKDINSLTPQMHKDSNFEQLIEKLASQLQTNQDNNSFSEVEKKNNSTEKKEFIIPKIRKLFTEGFDDEALNIFCQSYFSEVFNNFSVGQPKATKIMKLIDHCTRFGKMDELLQYAKDENEHQYNVNQPYTK